MNRILALGLMLVGITSAATVNFEFTSSLLYTSGEPVLFSGTLTNTGPVPAFINGDALTSALPFNDSPFLLNVPPVLAPGASITAPLFWITPQSGAPVGTYPGIFQILGGDDAGTTDLLAEAPFAVQVVPEPATWLAGSVLMGLVLVSALRAHRPRA